MPKREGPSSEFTRAKETIAERKSLPHFDLTTITGIKVDSVEVPEESQQMAKAYLKQLEKDGTNTAGKAEMAWAFRRQLQEDLRSVKEKELKELFLKEDPSYSFSLAIYRKLVSDTETSDKLKFELHRHEKEKNEINGTYEEFKNTEASLASTQDELIALLSEMFKRAGQDPKPVHLAKRALLEAKVADFEETLDALKKKNPDVAALIEYDTIKEYSDQLRTSGFIWTKSRRKLLQDVLTGALTSRPVVALMGETGSGKTALARAASIELSSREPERTVGGDQEKFVRLLASPAIQEGKTYYEYGPMLRAMTGKNSSIDEKPSRGGGIFFDDEFNTRPTSVQRQILKFVSEARAGREVAVPGTPLVIKVEPGFLYLAAGNPPSERYEREETGIETKREFAGNVLNVGYLEQTDENPELYQVLLAAFLDSQTGRLTAITKKEVEPEWIKDSATGESHIAEFPEVGGYIYRFAKCWSELLKAFSKQETILHKLHPADTKEKWYLPTFILDPGVVLSWIGQYKADPKARKGHISVFFADKLKKYIDQFPVDEQQTVKEYLTTYFVFGLPVAEDTKPKIEVLTPKDIGYLNPNVPRKKEKGPPPKFGATDFIDSNTGDVAFRYVKLQVKDGWDSGVRLKKKDIAPSTFQERVVFLGFLFDETTKAFDPTRAILVEENGAYRFIEPEGVRDFYELDVPPPPPSPETGVPFAYDKAKAREFGFSEMKIEKHENAQSIIDIVYNREIAFVNTYKAGTPDPDSTTTPKEILKQDKYKIIESNLKAAWANLCPDLPDIPEKSLWFFQALAEHRLSNTIDNDDPNNLTNPTSPHIPAFGQSEFLLAMDFREFDYDNGTEKLASLTPQTKRILKILFNTEDPTSISRNDINSALWTDHDNLVQSATAIAVIQELLGPGQNPDDFELRLMRYDEYSRAASSQNYGQKNLWTHFDGYYARADGRRHGLDGGARAYGGAAHVDFSLRDVRTDDLATRLVLSRKSPEAPPPPPPPEVSQPFAYDKTKAREYGFSEMKIEKHEQAQLIIDSVYARDPRYVTIYRAGGSDPDSTTTPKALLTQDKFKLNETKLKSDWKTFCPDLPNIPEKSMWFFQALAEHRLSNTIDSDDPNNLTNPLSPHIPAFGQSEFLLAMDFHEFDYNNDAEKQASLTPQTKRILKILFNTEDPTNISRDDINSALWTDHDNLVQSATAIAVIQELLGPGQNPDDFELRLMRYDEYSRAASSQNYGQKNLWTHFDGYYALADGRRRGLAGGYRGSGGSARVAAGHRDRRNGNLAVRLVLSRKS